MDSFDSLISLHILNILISRPVSDRFDFYFLSCMISFWLFLSLSPVSVFSPKGLDIPCILQASRWQFQEYQDPSVSQFGMMLYSYFFFKIFAPHEFCEFGSHPQSGKRLWFHFVEDDSFYL